MSHTFHAEIHEFGLADGCPECEEAGLNPLAFLDEEILRDLVARVAAETPPRSNAERSALAEIRGALNRFGRLAKLNPEPALGFLAGWGVHVTLAPAPPAAAPENAPELVGTGASTLAALFAPGQRVPELEDSDLGELFDLVLQEVGARGWTVTTVIKLPNTEVPS